MVSASELSPPNALSTSSRVMTTSVASLTARVVVERGLFRIMPTSPKNLPGAQNGQRNGGFPCCPDHLDLPIRDDIGAIAGIAFAVDGRTGGDTGFPSWRRPTRHRSRPHRLPGRPRPRPRCSRDYREFPLYARQAAAGASGWNPAFPTIRPAYSTMGAGVGSPG